MEVYTAGERVVFAAESDLCSLKGMQRVSHLGMLFGGEGLFWLDQNQLQQRMQEHEAKLQSLCRSADLDRAVLEQKVQAGLVSLMNKNWFTGACADQSVLAALVQAKHQEKKKVHLLALGDVGGTALTALKLLGGGSIAEIGIFDLNQDVCRRWEYEMNQTAYPWEYERLPEVHIIGEEELFDCDVFIFCASKGIPPVGSEVKDVRMVQFAENRKLIEHYGRLARRANFQGLFAVVSDPVDPLCKALFLASNEPEECSKEAEELKNCDESSKNDTRNKLIFDGRGLRPEQIQGYGLGVMNSRAAYYAKRDERFRSFLSEGRAFGPHGEELVIANSINHYDDAVSEELSRLAREANLRTREAGFKPYIAPALSSAALSILLTLEGKWHYSSNYLGGVFMGAKNRWTSAGLELEPLPLPQELYSRLERAYKGLEAII